MWSKERVISWAIDYISAEKYPQRGVLAGQTSTGFYLHFWKIRVYSEEYANYRSEADNLPAPGSSPFFLSNSGEIVFRSSIIPALMFDHYMRLGMIELYPQLDVDSSPIFFGGLPQCSFESKNIEKDLQTMILARESPIKKYGSFSKEHSIELLSRHQ